MALKNEPELNLAIAQAHDALCELDLFDLDSGDLGSKEEHDKLIAEHEECLRQVIRLAKEG